MSSFDQMVFKRCRYIFHVNLFPDSNTLGVPPAPEMDVWCVECCIMYEGAVLLHIYNWGAAIALSKHARWRHDWVAISALLVLCEGIHWSPVGSPHRGPVMHSFIQDNQIHLYWGRFKMQRCNIVMHSPHDSFGNLTKIILNLYSG